MTLDELIRFYIGEEGPQLPSDQYEERIECELDLMTPTDLLRLISRAFQDAGMEFNP